jgi:hypothetical protein
VLGSCYRFAFFCFGVAREAKADKGVFSQLAANTEKTKNIFVILHAKTLDAKVGYKKTKKKFALMYLRVK